MLPLIQNKYYIIRYGDFATNGNTKLGYGLFTLMLCMYEYIINNSLDCFIILIGSTTKEVITTFILVLELTYW